jgi:hypothetical protein
MVTYKGFKTICKYLHKICHCFAGMKYVLLCNIENVPKKHIVITTGETKLCDHLKDIKSTNTSKENNLSKIVCYYHVLYLLFVSFYPYRICGM